MSVRIAAIPGRLAPLLWPTISPMIDMAIEHSNGELCNETMLNRIINNDMLLLTVSNDNDIVAVLTLERRDFPSGKSILNITTAGGKDLDLWFEKIDETVCKLAEEQGCQEVYIVGRPGWQRKLKKLNYAPIHSVVSKKVGE